MEEQQDGRRGWAQNQETAYRQWVKQQAVPHYTGAYVEDLHTAEVADWPLVGARGAIISLAAQEQDDGWLIELAPGRQSEPLHHLFEATNYVVEGRGATTIWRPGSSSKQTVEWQSGSLFSPPLNCFYQHFNLDGQRPARLFAATTFPLMLNIVRSPEFIFGSDHVFGDRYNAAEDYFTNPGQRIATRRWQTNLIPDTRAFKLEEWKERGAGGSNMFFVMSGNAMSAHMSEFPPGSYKKAHRHGPGAELIILNGVGYSLLWFPGQKEKTKVDWKEGSIFSPRDAEYHQHFNSGPTPARYLAYTFGGLVVHNTEASTGADVSEREGGWQIEYEHEDPDVFEIFERECGKNGAQVSMDHPLRRVRR
ncbi:MAG: ethanolamine ammonia lyase-activating protein [Chloroflexi bacterium]|nr:ethanolamine ammonia lyase-activating protein [Chloroflexota bacterium]